MKLRKLFAVAVLVSLGLTLAACGDDDPKPVEKSVHSTRDKVSPSYHPVQPLIKKTPKDKSAD